jgi:Na+-translocating ferredoxin:NAD+ oxidoreductase RnfC subunit
VLHNIHRLWDFPGGVRLEGRKTQSLQQPLARMPIPARIVLPLQQHIGESAERVVEIGDRVLKGQLIAHTRVCGIVGMGGAGFPSAVRLDFPNKIDTLIINGAECEPYISCDEMLMRARQEAVIEGAHIMRHALRRASA